MFCFRRYLANVRQLAHSLPKPSIQLSTRAARRTQRQKDTNKRGLRKEPRYGLRQCRKPLLSFRVRDPLNLLSVFLWRLIVVLYGGVSPKPVKTRRGANHRQQCRKLRFSFSSPGRTPPITSGGKKKLISGDARSAAWVHRIVRPVVRVVRVHDAPHHVHCRATGVESIVCTQYSD